MILNARLIDRYFKNFKYLWSQIIGKSNLVLRASKGKALGTRLSKKNRWEFESLKGEIMHGSKAATNSSSQEWEMIKVDYQNDLSNDLQNIIN